MDAPRVQILRHDVCPNSITSQSAQSFEDVPLTPPYDKDQSSHASSVFSPVRLEHGIVTSGRVWAGSSTSDEVCERRCRISRGLLGQGGSAAVAGTRSEELEIVVDGQVLLCSEASKDSEREECGTTSEVFNLGLDLREPGTRSAASDLTLVETSVALDISGPLFASTLSPSGSPIPESDISDEPLTPSDYIDTSNTQASPTTSTYPPRPRIRLPSPKSTQCQTPTPSSPPASFDIPIPIFPYPAGTSRCRKRDCPIKIPHERGPYLHEGKLRTREGAIFGASNPPEEIWEVYDRLVYEISRGTADKASFDPVERFVRYHFGEIRGWGGGELEGVGGRGKVGRKAGGWRVWG